MTLLPISLRSTETFNAIRSIDTVVPLLQSVLGAQQRGVPDHGLHPGAQRLVDADHPTEEGPEETEAQGEEKSGEEETSSAFWCP